MKQNLKWSFYDRGFSLWLVKGKFNQNKLVHFEQMYVFDYDHIWNFVRCQYCHYAVPFEIVFPLDSDICIYKDAGGKILTIEQYNQICSHFICEDCISYIHFPDLRSDLFWQQIEQMEELV